MKFSLDEGIALQEFFEGAGWKAFEEWVAFYKRGANASLITSGKERHDFHVGQIKAYENILDARRHFHAELQRIKKEGHEL